MAPLLSNITIQVPIGTTNHSNPSILCTPSHWNTIATFYLGNYFAHAATIQQYPGEATYAYIRTILLALLFPTSGVFRGANSIWRCANFRAVPRTGRGFWTFLCQIFKLKFFETVELRKARNAGALCMVVKASRCVIRHQPFFAQLTHQGWMKTSVYKVAHINHSRTTALSQTTLNNYFQVISQLQASHHISSQKGFMVYLRRKTCVRSRTTVLLWFPGVTLSYQSPRRMRSIFLHRTTP